MQQFLPEIGAGPARVAEMAAHWQRAGARVTVITGMPNRPAGRIHPAYRGRLFVEEEQDGVRVLRSWLYASPKGGFSRTIANNASFMLTSGLHALVRRQKLDVLIASSPPFFPHVTGAVLSRWLKLPLVLEIRDLWPDYLVGMGVITGKRSQAALFGLERRLLQRAAHTIVVTESFRARVIAKGVPRELVDVISNGVDTNLYYPSSEPPPLSSLEPKQGAFTVGYLGNFGAGQALTTVVDAAALVSRSSDRIRFVLAGDGPDRENVIRRVAEHGLANIVVEPAITKDKTRAFYNACDLCLVPLAPYPIFQETVPSKIFEIMACERPVLACLAGEGARIVEASGGGLVRPPGDASAIADGILHASKLAPKEREELGRHGRAYVGEHYARERLAAKYLGILGRVARTAS